MLTLRPPTLTPTPTIYIEEGDRETGGREGERGRERERGEKWEKERD